MTPRERTCRECHKKLPADAFDEKSSWVCTDCCRKLWYKSSGEMRPEYDENDNPVPWWTDEYEGMPEWVK